MSTTELKNYYATIYRTLINERAIRAQIAYSLDRDRKVAAALVGVPSGPEAIKDELKARLITEEGGTDKTGAVQETLFHLPTTHGNVAYF